MGVLDLRRRSEGHSPPAADEVKKNYLCKCLYIQHDYHIMLSYVRMYNELQLNSMISYTIKSL